MSSVSKENNTQPLGQGSEEFLWGFTLQTARYSNHPLPRHSYSPNSCHQPPLVTALLLPEPGALVCRSGPSAGVAGAPGVAQVWSLTSWCPLSKDDLPPPRQNLASHTWRSVLPVLRRRTNVSQLGRKASTLGRCNRALYRCPNTQLLGHLQQIQPLHRGCCFKAYQLSQG